MKKLFISALIAISMVSTVFANDESKVKVASKVKDADAATAATKINVRVTRNFEKEFSEASNVIWSSKAGYAKASFTSNNVRMDAFFDQQGNLIGSSHAICLDDLPTNAKRVFAKKYAGYTVKEAIEFNALDETAFYLSAENESESLILKVSSGLVSVFKRTGKN